jgi:hypothetical protein
MEGGPQSRFKLTGNRVYAKSQSSKSEYKIQNSIFRSEGQNAKKEQKGFLKLRTP